MSEINNILKDVKLPTVLKVRQEFSKYKIENIEDTLIKKLNNKYLFYWMQTQSERIDKFYRGSGIQHPNMRNVLTLEIELPSIDEQKRIVSILDKFEKLCNDISEGLPAEIEARKKQYEYYRDKLLTFKELKVNE